MGGGNNQVWKNYSALSPFLFNFFFYFRSLKSNWERGKRGGEGAEFPVPRQGALSGLWSPGRLRLLLPFVVWDWGLWRRSRIMLGAAAFSCSLFILMCNFHLLLSGLFFFLWVSPTSQSPFFDGILSVGIGVRSFLGGSSIALEVKI